MTPAGEKPDSSRPRWLAVLLATVIMLFSYGMILFAFVAESESVFAGGVLGIGLGLVPVVFAACGFVSRSEHALKRGLIATGIWAVIVIPIGIVDLPTGLVAGFGGGGIVALDGGQHRSARARVLAVVAAAIYTFALQQASPEAGLFGGAPLPFLAIAVADVWAERRAGEDQA